MAMDDLVKRLSAVPAVRARGRVRAVIGLSLRATLPGARVGEVVRITRAGDPLLAEVVGFDDDVVALMPLGDLCGIGPDDAVEPVAPRLTVGVSDALLGRVLDGLGSPIDDGPALRGLTQVPVERPAPAALARKPIERPLATGVRAIDALVTLGEGQRIGLFSGSGVGKSTLLGAIARGTEADVVVVALVGERGREVREFLDGALGPTGLGRSVVVVATSDEPALMRLRAAQTATAIAERFRDEGKRVMLLVDSVTRFARAQREVGLGAGEAPARRGYPPSVFAALPRLLERSGQGARGSITAVYTVLVEGSDLDEPIADEVRGVLDGHVVLDRGLSARGRYPAIDPVASISRVMDAIVTKGHRDAARRVRALFAAYEAKRDLVVLGAYAKGTDPELDRALARLTQLEALVTQSPDVRTSLDDAMRALVAIGA